MEFQLYPIIQHKEPTAVILIKSSKSFALNTLANINRLFPNHFKNYIFITAVQVDIESYYGRESLKLTQDKTQKLIDYFVDYAHNEGYAAEGYSAIGTDMLEELIMLTKNIEKKS